MRVSHRILGLVAAAAMLAAAGEAPKVDLLPGQPQDNPAANSYEELMTAAGLTPFPDEVSELPEPDLGLVLPAADNLPELVRDVQAMDDVPLDTQTRCLATTVYYESKGEPLAGQLAVAQVVLNRVGDGRFGADICAVVTAPKQFSFVKGGTLSQPERNSQWQTAKAIALIAISNSWPEVVPSATHFHAVNVNPGWRLQRVATVGRHVFYH